MLNFNINMIKLSRIDLHVKILRCCGLWKTIFRSSAAALKTSVMEAAALCAYKKLISILRLRRSAQWVPEPRRSLKIIVCLLRLRRSELLCSGPRRSCVENCGGYSKAATLKASVTKAAALIQIFIFDLLI